MFVITECLFVHNQVRYFIVSLYLSFSHRHTDRQTDTQTHTQTNTHALTKLSKKSFVIAETKYVKTTKHQCSENHFGITEWNLLLSIQVLFMTEQRTFSKTTFLRFQFKLAEIFLVNFSVINKCTINLMYSSEFL